MERQPLIQHKFVSSRGISVIGITNGKNYQFKYSGYAVMETNWFSKYDKFVVDSHGVEYRILRYHQIYIELPHGRLQMITPVSLLKLDKPVKIGELLYIKQKEK